MKDSASGSRCVAAAELTRWNRPPSIWRSSGVMLLSLRPDSRARNIATRVGNPRLAFGFFASTSALFMQARPRPAFTQACRSFRRLPQGPRLGFSPLRRGFARFKQSEEQSTLANVVVVGAQWGDEGKGKIVDWLSVGADVVVRFQGGHNAGHTLVIDGKTYKLALLPSGIVRPGKLSIIGNGVVLDPYHLVEEIEQLRGQGVEVTPECLMVA